VDERQPKSADASESELRRDDATLLGDETRAAVDAAIERYTDIVARGGWPSMKTGRTIRPGDEDERLPAIARRLLISGDLRSRPGRTEPYALDDEIAAAVRSFQARHGIKPNGQIDRGTIQAMNVSADKRLAQLRITRVRLREMAAAVAKNERYVLVNAPAFSLEAVEGGRVQQRHRVIVGRSERQTPGVNALIKNINFFPFWHVPESVAHLDLIPRIKKEPDYLQKEKIRVLKDFKSNEEISPERVDWDAPEAKTLKFKQDPGPQNALGLVRIDMPNEHTVYMHDTPMKQLFAQRGRAFSAGCVRVEGVFDLVAWILRDVPGMDRAQIDVILNEGNPLDIPVPKPIPVHFVYVTAWAEPDGRVEFRPDLYGRDGTQELVASYTGEPAPTQTLAP
jgi:murein L,D-transpeptidase YcbB/YkuD